MIADWLFVDNLRPFLTVVGWVVGSTPDPDDWTAIDCGVRKTDAEAGCWYDHEFVGRHRAAVSLAIDPGSNVVHVRVDVPTDLEPQVRLAAAIFAYFRVRQ